MLEVTFLGTGTSQGVPVISCECDVCKSIDEHDKRLRSSVMVRSDSTTIIIDCGPDFRQQMLREDVKHIDAVLITHEHKDHIGGIDDIRAFNYTSGKAVSIYAEKRAQRTIIKDFDYAFSDNPYPGVPEIKLVTIDQSSFSIGDIDIQPIRGMHHKLPVLGFRIGDFCYLTDMNYICKEEVAKIVGVKVLVINALRKEKHISHFTLDQAIETVYKTNPERAYLTHLSHQMGCHKDIITEVPPHIFFAYDRLKIEI